MQVAVVGTCEKSCSLYLREQITKAFETLVKKPNLEATFVLLSTCRRVELYFSSEDLTSTHTEIIQQLRLELNKSFEHVLYSLFDAECFFHLMKVTSGLDSSITGESEIQKQVKLAYEGYKKQQKLSLSLHYIFQKSLRVGKTMRSSFEFFKKQDSFAHIILSQLNILSPKTFKEQKLLFIGNSQINRRMLPIFFAKNFQQIILISKNNLRNTFPCQKNFSLTDYKALNQLHHFDAVICATKSSDYLITPKQDFYPHQIFFDLSIPRAIDPQVKDKAPLLNIEELGILFEKRKLYVQKEIASCEKAVAALLDRYTQLFLEKKQRQQIYSVEAIV